MTDPQLDAAERAFRAAYLDPGLMRHALRKAVEAADKAAWQPISGDAFGQEYVLAGRLSPHVGWRAAVVKWKPIYPFTHWRPLPTPPESAS